MSRGRFRSTTEHVLDAKGRLNFPSRFREVLSEYDSDVLVVVPWGADNLRLYPLVEWEDVEDRVLTEGRGLLKLAAFIRSSFGRATPCRLDKQGRIQLPLELRVQVGLDKNVMVVGMIHHVEIWNKAVWQQGIEESNENFESFQDQLSQMGIF